MAYESSDGEYDLTFGAMPFGYCALRELHLLDLSMDHLSYYRDILERAISGQLPSQIDRDSDVSVKIFHELFEEGLVTGIDISSMNQGLGYLNPAITLKGREYLDDLTQRNKEKSLRGRAKKFGWLVLGWLGGVGSTVLAEWLGKLL